MDEHGTGNRELADVDSLSIAVIGPGDYLRRAIIEALSPAHHGDVQEFPSYPPTLDDIPHLLNQKYDCIMIELDSDPEYALKVIQIISAGGRSTVTVYSRMSESEIADPDLLMRCMRMGAREFISLPFSPGVITDTLRRAASRRTPVRETKAAPGRLYVFSGTKGGVGVTNIACNFAISLAKQSNRKTLLLDLDIPLGDTALNLGIRPLYSTLDALENWNRLDSAFLSKLLAGHPSGLAVLPAPGQFSTLPVVNEAIDQLLKAARESFENVVVDSGSKLDLANGCTGFKSATKIYLVTQTGIPELRNANRLITRYMGVEGLHLEVVLNRYETGRTGISDQDIRKALTRNVDWRIPNDYRLVRAMQDTSSPVIGTDSLIARRIDDMVRSTCGLPQPPSPRKAFSFRNLFSSAARSEPSSTPLGIGSIEPQIPAGERCQNENCGDQRRPPVVRTDAAGNQPCVRVFEGRIYQRDESGAWHPAVGAFAPPITVEWSRPDPITYGTPLSKAQCNATTSVPGRFHYTPGEGIVLPAAGHTLWVSFIPDSHPSLEIHSSTEVSVMKASADLRWPAPAAIPYGTALGARQLNATASIPGTFEYTPGPGEVLEVGLHSLQAQFAPSDPNYMSAAIRTSLAVVESARSSSGSTPRSLKGTYLTRPWHQASGDGRPAEGQVAQQDGVSNEVAGQITAPGIAVARTLSMIAWQDQHPDQQRRIGNEIGAESTHTVIDSSHGIAGSAGPAPDSAREWEQHCRRLPDSER